MRAELQSFIRNLLIGLNIKVPAINVEFTQSELPELLPVDIAYCKDFGNLPRPISKIIAPATMTREIAADTSIWKDKWNVSLQLGNQ